MLKYRKLTESTRENRPLGTTDFAGDLDATTRDQAERLMAQFADLYGRAYPRAVECLLKDQEALLTYYRYPQEHWVSLKTTNPIESIFATVKLRIMSSVG